MSERMPLTQKLTQRTGELTARQSSNPPDRFASLPETKRIGGVLTATSHSSCLAARSSREARAKRRQLNWEPVVSCGGRFCSAASITETEVLGFLAPALSSLTLSCASLRALNSRPHRSWVA